MHCFYSRNAVFEPFYDVFGLSQTLMMFQDYLNPNFSWKNLFEPYPYVNTYTWFTKIHLSAANQENLSNWVGWVKSRFRCLLIKVRTSIFGSTLSV